MHPVALAAREVLDELLLVAALEVEATAVGARVDLVVADLDHVLTVRDFGPHGLRGVERVAALIHVRELHALADAQPPAARLLAAGDHFEQRGLAGAVRADHADDAALG